MMLKKLSTPVPINWKLWSDELVKGRRKRQEQDMRLVLVLWRWMYGKFNFNPQSVTQEVHSLFRSELSTHCDLMLPFSTPSNLSFPEGHPLAACIFFLVFPSRLSVLPIFPSIACFRRQFLRKLWPIQLPFLLFIVYSIFLSFLTLSHNTQFFTRSVRLIFCSPLQHHISKLFR
jgi:hypothetical protein